MRLRTIALVARAIPLCLYWWPQWMWRDARVALRQAYKRRLSRGMRF